MEDNDRQLVPTSVIIAAAIGGIIAANHFVLRALPALLTLDPYGLVELLVVGICFSIVWGLLTLRRWALLAALLLSGAGCVFPLFMMQDLESFKLETGFPGHSLVIQFLLFLEFASFMVFILLMSDTSKAAFAGRAAHTETEHEEESAPAAQTASG